MSWRNILRIGFKDSTFNTTISIDVFSNGSLNRLLRFSVFEKSTINGDLPFEIIRFVYIFPSTILLAFVITNSTSLLDDVLFEIFWIDIFFIPCPKWVVLVTDVEPTLTNFITVRFTNDSKILHFLASNACQSHR